MNNNGVLCALNSWVFCPKLLTGIVLNIYIEMPWINVEVLGGGEWPNWECKFSYTGCVLLAVYKLDYKYIIVTLIGMRPIRGETRHKIGQLLCRNVTEILSENWP